MRKILYLINPISGTRSKANLREQIAARTRAAGIEHAIYPSVESGNYSFLHPIIREEGFTDVVIAGGDGTINQAVGNLRKLHPNFGIIPCGSGNGLAFSASIPRDREKALDIVIEGKTGSVDAFTINGQFACMLCGLGLDAQVAHDFANDPKRGLTTYIKKTITSFFNAPSYPFVLTAKGRQIRTEAFFISLANSNQFGNHFTIAPKASLNDGLLDIVVMSRQNKLSALVQALIQVSGLHRLKKLEVVSEKDSLLYFQTNEIRIKNPRSAPLHIDGDPVETTKELHIKVIPGAFKLIQPR